jgi:hypothetical protein
MLFGRLNYIVAVSFIGGGNQRILRKPPTCRKSLTNFYHIMLYTSPWSRFELTTSVVIGKGSCKFNYHMIKATTALEIYMKSSKKCSDTTHWLVFFTYCDITFICGVPIFVGRLTHEIKNPTNNETWEAVWHRYYIAMLSSSDLDFRDQLHRGSLTILMTK